ncbi:MAG: sugar ABC transporter substrate-binding protein [Candidatus Nanopelagicales bacterium]
MPALRTPFAAIAAALVLFGSLVFASPVHAAPRDIVVWVPQGFKPAALAAFPESIDGHRIQVRVRDMSNLAERLLSGSARNAPDLIFIDSATTGPLAAAALLQPIDLRASTRRTLGTAAVDGFRYGFNVYGVPMQTQNVALITNADLVPEAPRTFTQLRRAAMRLKRDGTVQMPLALGQEPTDAAADALYPLFSGLGGFTFGTNAGGSLDPTKVGIDNAAFQKNSDRIDTWNSGGFIDSAITRDQAREAFLSGQAPFWIAYPEDIAALTQVGFRYRITSVPRIVTGFTPSPLLRSYGFAVTTFARQHGVAEVASALVQSELPGARAQRTFADSSPLVGLPANANAAATVTNRQLVAFGAAAADAIAYPNIAQWGPASVALVGAWRASTRGADADPAAVPAAESFAAARTAVRQGAAGGR